MDITSLIGLVGTAVIIFVTIIIEGGNPLSYINVAAALTAIGGTLMACCLAYPMDLVKKAPAGLMKVIKSEHHNLVETVSQLVEMCSMVRREGLLALDSMVKNFDDPFLARGTQFVVDGLDPESTRLILEADLAAKKHRHAEVRGIYDFLGSVAPGYALVGTLLGLVAMLSDLDPSTVGHKMALALLCTFYGCGLANAFFMPVGKKLAIKSDEEIFRYKLILEGLLGIQAGENPRNLEDRLKAYLPAAIRQQITDASGGAAKEAA
ncbi:MAG: motility protein A [Fimbriimonadaceae bacterium]|nr:motility protein A [Fimbriimonadaceae bacterium]